MSLITSLTVLFVAFKITNLLDWSWWLIFTPVWVGIILVVFLAFLQAVTDTRTPLQKALDEMSAGLRRERLSR